VIREDRELLAQLARLGTDLVPFAMRLIDDIASVDEQARYAERLIAAGERLHRRAGKTAQVVIEGEVLAGGPTTLPELTGEPHREP
jgi:NaMN:DMB phosphoribosyltransferase